MDFTRHPVVSATSANAEAHGCACTVDQEGTLEITGPDGKVILRTSIADIPFDPKHQQAQVMTLEFEQAIIARDKSVIGQTAYGLRPDGVVERMDGMSMSRNDDGTMNMSFQLSDDDRDRMQELFDRLDPDDPDSDPEAVNAALAAMMEQVVKGLGDTTQVLGVGGAPAPSPASEFEGIDPACDALAATVSRIAYQLDMEPQRTTVEQIEVFLDPDSMTDNRGLAFTLNIGAMARDGIRPDDPDLEAYLHAKFEEQREKYLRDQGTSPAMGGGPVDDLARRFSEIAAEVGLTTRRVSESEISLVFSGRDSKPFDLGTWVAQGVDAADERFEFAVRESIFGDVYIETGEQVFTEHLARGIPAQPETTEAQVIAFLTEQAERKGLVIEREGDRVVFTAGPGGRGVFEVEISRLVAAGSGPMNPGFRAFLEDILPDIGPGGDDLIAPPEVVAEAERNGESTSALTGGDAYDNHPLVATTRRRAEDAGLTCTVDEGGTLTIATTSGDVIFAISVAAVSEDPTDRSHQIMARELGKVIDTRDASVMGTTAYGVRHDGTIEEIGTASVSGEGDEANFSISLGNIFGETGAVDDPSVRGIDPQADRMADLMAREAERIEGVTIARTAVDEVTVMDEDGVACATFAVASYAASGADLDNPWLGREIRSWLCEQVGISDELPEGEVSWATTTSENTAVIDPQAMLESMGLGDIRIRPDDPVERLFQYLEEVADDNGLRAVMTDADNAALLDDSGKQVLTANLNSMSEKGLADDRDYFRLQIQDALHRLQPMAARTDDGWLTAHLRRDGQDFYEGAAMVERFSSAGMDFALIPHYENAMSLHHLLPHMVEEMGGEGAVRERLLADRERAEFIIQATDTVSAPDGTQALMLVGDNIATMLIHPGLHRTLVEAIDIGPDELAAPDDPIGPMMAFAPSTTIIAFFPTARINDMLPQIKQWAEGVSPAGEPLLYGCLLRNYPDEPWGRIIDRTR